MLAWIGWIILLVLSVLLSLSTLCSSILNVSGLGDKSETIVLLIFSFLLCLATWYLAPFSIVTN